MFNVVCYTNLDLHGEQWPNFLPAVPNVGDLIQSRTVRNFKRVELEVCRITWKYDEYHKWYPEIEMGYVRSRWHNISHFMAWYDYIWGRLTQEQYQEIFRKFNSMEVSTT